MSTQVRPSVAFVSKSIWNFVQSHLASVEKKIVPFPHFSTCRRMSYRSLLLTLGDSGGLWLWWRGPDDLKILMFTRIEQQRPTISILTGKRGSKIETPKDHRFVVAMLSIQRLLVFRHIWSEGNALEAKVLGHLQKHRDAPSASECDPEKDVESWKSFWGGKFSPCPSPSQQILVTECETKKYQPDLVPCQLRRSSFTFKFHVERVFQSYIFPPRNLMSLTSSLPTNAKIMQPLPSWAFPRLG